MSNPTRPPFIQATTSEPCPAWCTDHPGHGYDGLLIDGDEARFHTREFPSGSGDKSLAVDLVAQERLRVTENGVSVEIDPARIWLYGDLDMIGPQARALAAALIVAADLWDQVSR